MSDSYNLQSSLGYQATLFSRISERRFERELLPLGLTRVNWCVLLAVGHEGLQNPSAIAPFVGIDRTATSRALRRLDADGLVMRENSTEDHRKTNVTITAKGKQKLVQANSAASANADHFNAKLSWFEQRTLKEILEKLVEDEVRDVSKL